MERNIESKIILLGDSGVGKSSIALRFRYDRFDEVSDATIGAAYLSQVVPVPIPSDPRKGEYQVKLHIWDTAGHERFRSMINMYYKDTMGAVICYDMSSEQSFNQVTYWVNEMKKNH